MNQTTACREQIEAEIRRLETVCESTAAPLDWWNAWDAVDSTTAQALAHELARLGYRTGRARGGNYVIEFHPVRVVRRGVARYGLRQAAMDLHDPVTHRPYEFATAEQAEREIETTFRIEES